jgi:hypothetical protein
MSQDFGPESDLPEAALEGHSKAGQTGFYARAILQATRYCDMALQLKGGHANPFVSERPGGTGEPVREFLDFCKPRPPGVLGSCPQPAREPCQRVAIMSQPAHE